MAEALEWANAAGVKFGIGSKLQRMVFQSNTRFMTVLEFDLYRLSQQPESLRDEKWEADFLSALTLGHLQLEDLQPQQGPDGWPYLYAKTSPTAKEPTNKILSWLNEKGVGLVVNGSKTVPDYVFTYGAVWNFCQTGQFFTPTPERSTGQVLLKQGQQIYSGAPSKEYLPNHVCLVLKQFFDGQGVEDLRVLMVSLDQKIYDLYVSLDSLGNPPDNEHPGIAQAIQWFLPEHYSLVLAQESGLPKFFHLNQFETWPERGV